MPLKGLLKKKDKANKEAASASQDAAITPATENTNMPEIPTFVRTTTHTQEVIQPPTYPGDELPTRKSAPKQRKSFSSHFRKSSNVSTKSATGSVGEKVDTDATRTPPGTPPRGSIKGERRISERFKLGLRSRSASATSAHVPEELPEIQGGAVGSAEKEVEWEKRATLLAKGGSADDIGLENGVKSLGLGGHEADGNERGAPGAGDEGGDETLQEAIRLHEAGELERSTAIFGKLADPHGANNALSQVLYGLALRHGWGITPSPAQALHYLRLAARSAALTETAALSSAGSTSGGPAKGELVLAIFELANSFRHGWGVEKDPVAAYRYYETAANLGDVDGMEWVAWCYSEGFGVGKDRYKAAQYLRLAESKGHKVLGNSWIWKEKYNPKT